MCLNDKCRVSFAHFGMIFSKLFYEYKIEIALLKCNIELITYQGYPVSCFENQRVWDFIPKEETFLYSSQKVKKDTTINIHLFLYTEFTI